MELRLAAPGPARPAGQLPHDFVFPSGRRCRTYDDLAQACHEEWSAASEMLRQGAFRQFLTGLGRMDLAPPPPATPSPAVGDVAVPASRDRLPTAEPLQPRLDIRPRRLSLGQMQVGETCEVEFVIANQGKGLLHGTLAVTEGNGWLRVGGPEGKTKIDLK